MPAAKKRKRPEAKKRAMERAPVPVDRAALVKLALQSRVPLWISKWRGFPQDDLLKRADECARDLVMARSRSRDVPVPGQGMFDRLAESVALLALTSPEKRVEVAGVVFSAVEAPAPPPEAVAALTALLKKAAG